MLDRPPLAVAEWLDSQPHLSIWTTSISVFEVRFGLSSMPAGRRWAKRIEAFERILADVIEQRIAHFDGLRLSGQLNWLRIAARWDGPGSSATP